MEDTDKESKIRLSFDVRPATKALMEALQERSGASSLSEVLRKALALYDMVVDHQACRGSLVLENEDGTREKLRLL